MGGRHCKYCNMLYHEGDQNYCSYECYVLADLPSEGEDESGSES